MGVWNPKANALFLQAIELPAPERRSAFLDEACAGDPALRVEVEQLLKAHDEAGNFFQSPLLGDKPTQDWTADSDRERPRTDLGPVPDAPKSPGPTLDPPVPEGPRRVIGPYKLLEQIGEGGMGVVYRAEQIEPVERQVALKIIKPGMDSRQVIARFEAEEQALAMMDHPNIAKVFEGGTTDSGQPYFVMELIKGIPITRYCDEHHLTPRQRLDLFVPVCHAVQHAHQKGIIHRDIKPTNVLVAEYDDRPVPKIIDFGVAKATEQRLTERSVFTQFGQVVGTLEYMSPEQAGLNHLDIDTRSDIYSLGVLLYELLTGERPFDRQRLRSAAFDEMLRIIREEEPPKPSTRLNTSESLPSIAANRHTEPKKLSTLVRGELDWIVMKALEKDRTRRYETANGFANDIQRYLNDEPVLACPPSAAYRLKKFARRNKATLTIVSVAALVLVAVAIGAGVAAVRFRDLAQRNASLAAEKQAALTSALAAEQAATTARDQEAAQREEAQRQTQLAKDALADVEREQQRAEGNLDLAMEALDLIYVWSIGRNRLLGKPISRPAELEPLTTDERPLFSDLERTLLKRGLGFYDAFARRNATAPRASLRTAQAYLWVGLISGALGDPTAAAEAYHGAIERFEQLTKEEPGNAEHFRQLAETYRGLADVVPQWEAAKQWSEKSRQAYSRAIELKPDDILAYLGRATILERLDRAKAVTDYEKALQLDPHNIDALLACAHVYEKTRGREYAERAVALAPDNPKCHVELAEKLSTENCTWIGPGRMICPDPEPALKHYARAIELAPASPRGYRARGKFYRRIEDNERALADLNRALELDPSDRWAIKNRGIVLARLSQFDKALADLARHMQIYPHDVDVQRQILDIHLATKNWESAVESITGILEYDPPDSEKLRELRIEGYLSLGRDDEALADCDRCVELKPDKARPVMIRAELLATAGRIEEYRRACSDILKRFSQSGDEWDLYHAARACVILPQAVPDPTEPVKLATQAVSKYPMAWTRYALGMAHLRAGQLDEAEQHFDELSRKTHLYPLCWLGLALVQQERGNAEEARNWLVKAVTRIEACGLYSLEERLEYQLLRREVQQPAAPWNLPAGAPPPAIAPFDAKKAHPVVNLTWNDVTAFCAWLSEKEGEKSHLPTEAQWEYVCRAGATTTWHSGDDEQALKEHGWFSFNAENKTHSVGQKTPNAWGVYDLHGNVFERCQDWLDDLYYATSPMEDPPGASGGSLRVNRGGSWAGGASFCRASYRNRSDPGARDERHGFRLARTVSSR